jgi:hypothetical protein
MLIYLNPGELVKIKRGGEKTIPCYVPFVFSSEVDKFKMRRIINVDDETYCIIIRAVTKFEMEKIPTKLNNYYFVKLLANKSINGNIGVVAVNSCYFER